MKLQLERPLIFFDIEATGLDITNDRIIELTILKLMPDGERIVRTRRFNPPKARRYMVSRTKMCVTALPLELVPRA